MVEADVAHMGMPLLRQNVQPLLVSVWRAASRFVRQYPIIPSRRRFDNCILIAERYHDSGGSFQICYIAGILDT
jgi:hypothetical protein